MERRDFLTKGFTGVAGVLALGQTGCRKGENKKDRREQKHKLVCRTLGRTGLKVPIVSLGSMEVTSKPLVRMALDAGIRHIATSRYYSRGRVARFVGKLIKNYRREDIILATGIDPYPPAWKEGYYSKDTDVVKFEKDFYENLKVMGVDYVDILYVPNAARKESVMFEPLMRVTEKLKKAGRARFLGIGTHSYVPEAIRAAADSNHWDIVMAAYNFQSKDIVERRKAVDYAAGKGLGIVAMKTVTGASFLDTEKQVTVGNPAAALKWVLQNPNIHTAVLGITTFDQLESDLGVMADLTLSEEERKYLKLARMNSHHLLFCQGCGSCLKQCPSAPDIPTLMRCFMYAYGYRDLAAAAKHLAAIEEKVACGQCPSCTVNCAMGFNIKARVLDIMRLKNIPQDLFV